MIGCLHAQTFIYPTQDENMPTRELDYRKALIASHNKKLT